MSSTSSMQSRPSKRPRLPTMWICALPQDLLLRIAWYVSGGRQNDDALVLAESSPCQRAAVVSVLSNKLVVPTQHVDRWVRIFTGSVEEVQVQALTLNSTLPNVVNLLKSNTLQSAVIWERPIFLRPLAEARSLQRLEVTIHEQDHRLLLQTLAVHSLRHLALHCDHDQSGRSGCKCLLSSPPSGLLRSRCPNLETLEIRSDCIKAPNLIAIISNLSRLQRVALNIHQDCGRFSDEDVQVLRSLKTVDLISAPDAGIVAPKLGSVVNALHPWPPLTEHQLRQVTHKCQALKMFYVSLDSETEKVLVECIPEMSQLRYLAIDYCHEVEPSPGVLLDIVRAAPGLVGLNIGSIEIEVQELVAIVREMGPRLEALVTSHRSQDERDCKSVAILLETLATYNPGIRQLHMITLPGYTMPSETCKNVWRMWRQRILKAHQRLRALAPHLDHEKIESAANTVCGIPKRDEGVETLHSR